MKNLDDVLRRVEAAVSEQDYATIKALVDAYAYLAELVEDKNTSIGRLRKLLFGAKTEKTAVVVGGGKTPEAPAPSETDAPSATAPEGKGKAAAEENAGGDGPTCPHPDPLPEKEGTSPSDSPAGHGRNGADAYTGGEKIEVRHGSLQAGDACPECDEGTVYRTNRPGVLVRLMGQPPIGAKVYSLEKLRCNLCGVVFTAEPPPGVGDAKCDATVGSMIALLKYGSGMPFHRAARLQASLGIPLSASTQWDIVKAQAERAEPVFDELVRQAAQGEVVHNDDTWVRILEWMGQRRQAALTKAAAVDSGGESETKDAGKESETKDAGDRTGMFTTGIVATAEGHRIALFLSGRQHAGENLADVLARRAAERPAPIQMCDALSRNLPGELKTILANCLAHARRRFVDVVESFPDECRHVLESLAVVYRNDALARQRCLTPDERLLFHQAESGPTMEQLHAWLAEQFDQRRVEPNSALGKAISYLLRHWDELTLFLRVAGAPLDNNVCERALKKAILHRKNAYFYKTPRGAHVGDLFMSLIHTCELCGTSPFDYLTELERHVAEASSNPRAWMPWNYRKTSTGSQHDQAAREETCQEGRRARAGP